MPDRSDDFSFEDAGEVQVVPWPLLLKHKVTEKVEAHPHYPWIVLATALFGLFSVGFTITILSNSIPRIARDLNSDESTLTWVVTAPLLAFAVFGPAAGKLADLRGQRRVYLWSLGGVCVFAGLTAVAPNAATLIAFRSIGAAIGAAEAPASLAIITRTFSSNQRAQSDGDVSMVAPARRVIGVIAAVRWCRPSGLALDFVAQCRHAGDVVLAAAVCRRCRGIAAALRHPRRGDRRSARRAVVVAGDQPRSERGVTSPGHRWRGAAVALFMAFMPLRNASPIRSTAGYLRRRNFCFRSRRSSSQLRILRWVQSSRRCSCRTSSITKRPTPERCSSPAHLVRHCRSAAGYTPSDRRARPARSRERSPSPRRWFALAQLRPGSTISR